MNWLRDMLLAAGLAGLAAVATPVAAHPGYFGTAFHAHDLPEAVTVATQEYKLIFVYVGTEDGHGWPVFRWLDAEKRELIDALVRETVIVEATPSTLGQLSGYAPNAPEILILNQDRELLERFPGDTPAAAIARALSDRLGGAAAVERAQALRAARPADDFFARERLATAYWENGDEDAALTLIESLGQECVDEVSMAASSRRPYVMERLARWTRASPNARGLVERLVERAEARLRSGQGEPRLAESVAGLHKALGQRSRSLALFNAIPAGSPARAGLVDTLAPRLVSAGRSEELLELIDPAKAFAGERDFYDLMRVTRPVQADLGEGRGSRSFVINRGLLLIKALQQAGRDSEAQTLSRELLAFDGSPTTQNALQDLNATATSTPAVEGDSSVN
jgi:hypothetical protein